MVVCLSRWALDIIVNDQKDEFSAQETEKRFTAALRRALTTAPTPTKELIGKTERAQNQRESRAIGAFRTTPKAP